METQTISMVNTDIHIVKTELYDANVMDALVRDTKSFSKRDLTRLSMYKKGRLHGNNVEVVYHYAKGCEKERLGRLYVRNGQGLQAFPFDMRNPLLEKNYWDIDMENAHYHLLWKLADSWGLKTDAIRQYIDNREVELERVSPDRRISKTTFLKIAYGGHIKLYNEFYNDVSLTEGADLSLVRRIEKEMLAIVDMCWSKYSQHHKLVKKKDNPKFSLFALILQTEECKCLLAIDEFMKLNDRNVDIFIHDGCEIRKLADELTFPEELMRGAEEYVKQSVGYDVRLKNKPFKHSFKAPTVPLSVEVSPSVIVDDAFASKKFAELMGDKIILDGSTLYAFDDTTGIWSSDEKFIKRLITNSSSALIFTQGDKMYNYSGSVKNTNNLYIKLFDVVQRSNDFFKNRIHSAMWKLLFSDGIYDAETDTFTEGFDPEIIFHHAIPRQFPRVRNEEAEAFVRNSLFIEPFLNTQAGDVLLHYLSRGIFGDFLMKTLLFCLGKGNSSKGTLCNVLSAVFGGLVGSFNGNSLIQRTGDVEATKSISWVKNIATRRFAFSNEITIDADGKKKIDGNMLKTLASGGDEITFRTNHRDEEVIVNQSLIAFFMNDLPPITPQDNELRNRVVAIPYYYTFTDEPTEPFHKKGDNQIKLKLTRPEMLDAFVCIVIDTMKNWIKEKKPISIPDECFGLRDEIAPSNSINISKIINKEYEITGNPDDYVVAMELQEYLKDNGVEGSPNKLGMYLNDLGIKRVQKWTHNKKNEKVRTGIKRKDAV
jgi:hypothetical protein